MGWFSKTTQGGGADAKLYIKGDSTDPLNVKRSGVTWTKLGAVTQDSVTYDHRQGNNGHNIYVQRQLNLVAM